MGQAPTGGRNVPPGARQRECRRHRGRAAAGEWAAAPRLTSGGHSTCRVQKSASVGTHHQVREPDKSATRSSPRTTKQGTPQRQQRGSRTSPSPVLHRKAQVQLFAGRDVHRHKGPDSSGGAARTLLAAAGRRRPYWWPRRAPLPWRARPSGTQKKHHADACRGELRWRRLPRQPRRRGSSGCRRPPFSLASHRSLGGKQLRLLRRFSAHHLTSIP